MSNQYDRFKFISSLISTDGEYYLLLDHYEELYRITMKPPYERTMQEQLDMIRVLLHLGVPRSIAMSAAKFVGWKNDGVPMNVRGRAAEAHLSIMGMIPKYKPHLWARNVPPLEEPLASLWLIDYGKTSPKKKGVKRKIID